jgi:glycosyltransferase involved in cell wall biosynthesis
MPVAALNPQPADLLGSSQPEKIRLAYVVSHPIQYQSPLLRRIAAEPAIELTVLFGSSFSLKTYRDEGFGVDVSWGIPLLEGFRHEFLPALRDTGTEGLFSPISRSLFARLADFDVLWVHGYATINQLQAILAANLRGIPVLVRSDSSLRDRPRGSAKLFLKRLFFNVLARLIDGVLVSGTLNHRYWQHYLGPSAPLFLLPYAVDNLWFQAQVAAAKNNRAELQSALRLDPSRPVILFASKMQKRKNCTHLIEAYARLSPALGKDPIPYLLLVGDGEERSALELQAGQTGFDSIRFCGFRDQIELPRFFDLATVFVLPARHEPWGLIVNEVMNAACPVIVSNDVGCHPDLITQGVEGLVYPVGDIDALEHCLRTVLAAPEAASAMGHAALRRINQWSFDQDLEGLKQAIAAVIGAPVPSPSAHPERSEP